jgi:hypothetical protein
VSCYAKTKLVMMTLFILETCEAVMADYKCSHYAKGKCKARLKGRIEVINDEDDANNVQKKLLLTLNGQHTCSILQQHEIILQDKSSSEMRNHLNVVEEMKILVTSKALNCYAKTCREVAVEVYNETKEKYKGLYIFVYILCFNDIIGTFYHGQTTSQMESLVDRTRRKQYGTSDGAIRCAPLVYISDTSNKFFLLFDIHITLKNKVSHIIGWGHNDLIHILKTGPKYIFVDCTFKCAPVKFVQCMVIMIYEPATELYIPIFYILLPNKEEDTYRIALHHCIMHCGYKFEGISFSCDFEIGLMNAIKKEFNNPPIIGCLFHWKQALRRKLLVNGIPRNVITLLMDKKGLINLLTVIPIAEIENKGIPYIRSNFNEGVYSKHFDKFWSYFTHTWLGIYPPCDWNIHGILRFNSNTIINRTNNPLERFNRRLNSSFKKGTKPSLVHFVTKIREISDSDVNTYLRVKNGDSNAFPHQDLSVFKIPQDYHILQTDTSITQSKSAVIDGYNFVIGTTHWDSDDNKMYKVVKISYYGDNVVGHRLQIPTNSSSALISKEMDEDCISMHEILSYMNFTTAQV